MPGDIPDDMLVNGGLLSLDSCSEGPVLFPVYAIHEEKDIVMCPVEVVGCRLIRGPGQGMIVTHADKVTHFWGEVLTGNAKYRKRSVAWPRAFRISG